MTEKRWEYLLSEPYQARYAIAAHYVRGCPVVVEIGAWRQNISEYLDPAVRMIVVVDPLLERNEREGRVEYLRQAVETVPLCLMRPMHGHYGLVCLGLDLGQHPEPALERIAELANTATVTVLEWAVRYKPVEYYRDWLLREIEKRVAVRLALDFTGNNGVPQNGFQEFPEREMLVLR